MTRKSTAAQARKAAAASSAQQELQARIEQAQAYHAAGALVLAELTYEDVLARHPGQAQALQGLGVLLGQRGDLLRGIDLIDRALRLAPHNPVFHCNRALLVKDLMRWTEARAGFERAIA